MNRCLVPDSVLFELWSSIPQEAEFTVAPFAVTDILKAKGAGTGTKGSSTGSMSGGGASGGGAPKAPSTPETSSPGSGGGVKQPKTPEAKVSSGGGGGGQSALTGIEMPGHRWLSREMIGSKSSGAPKYRYKYSMSQGLGRGVKAGTEINVGYGKEKAGAQEGGDVVRVKGVSDKGVTFEHGGEEKTVSHEDWHNKMVEHFGDDYTSGIDRNVRRWGNAVYKHVPREAFDEIESKFGKNATSAQIVQHIKDTVDSVHKTKVGDKLQKTFDKIGIHDEHAVKHMIGHVLSRRGWDNEARATLLGAATGGMQAARVAKHYKSMVMRAEKAAGSKKVSTAHITDAINHASYRGFKDYHEHKDAQLLKRLHEHNDMALRMNTPTYDVTPEGIQDFAKHEAVKRSERSQKAQATRMAEGELATEKQNFLSLKKLSETNPDEFERVLKERDQEFRIGGKKAEGKGGTAGFKEKFLEAPSVPAKSETKKVRAESGKAKGEHPLETMLRLDPDYAKADDATKQTIRDKYAQFSAVSDAMAAERSAKKGKAAEGQPPLKEGDPRKSYPKSDKELEQHIAKINPKYVEALAKDFQSHAGNGMNQSSLLETESLRTGHSKVALYHAVARHIKNTGAQPQTQPQPGPQPGPQPQPQPGPQPGPQPQPQPGPQTQPQTQPQPGSQTPLPPPTPPPARKLADVQRDVLASHDRLNKMGSAAPIERRQHVFNMYLDVLAHPELSPESKQSWRKAATNFFSKHGQGLKASSGTPTPEWAKDVPPPTREEMFPGLPSNKPAEGKGPTPTAERFEEAAPPTREEMFPGLPKTPKPEAGAPSTATSKPDLGVTDAEREAMLPQMPGQGAKSQQTPPEHLKAYKSLEEARKAVPDLEPVGHSADMWAFPVPGSNETLWDVHHRPSRFDASNPIASRLFTDASTGSVPSGGWVEGVAQPARISGTRKNLKDFMNVGYLQLGDVGVIPGKVHMDSTGGRKDLPPPPPTALPADAIPTKTGMGEDFDHAQHHKLSGSQSQQAPGQGGVESMSREQTYAPGADVPPETTEEPAAAGVDEPLDEEAVLPPHMEELESNASAAIQSGDVKAAVDHATDLYVEATDSKDPNVIASAMSAINDVVRQMPEGKERKDLEEAISHLEDIYSSHQQKEPTDHIAEAHDALQEAVDTGDPAKIREATESFKTVLHEQVTANPELANTPAVQTAHELIDRADRHVKSHEESYGPLDRERRAVWAEEKRKKYGDQWIDWGDPYAQAPSYIAEEEAAPQASSQGVEGEAAPAAAAEPATAPSTAAPAEPEAPAPVTGLGEPPASVAKQKGLTPKLWQAAAAKLEEGQGFAQVTKDIKDAISRGSVPKKVGDDMLSAIKTRMDAIKAAAPKPEKVAEQKAPTTPAPPAPSSEPAAPAAPEPPAAPASEPAPAPKAKSKSKPESKQEPKSEPAAPAAPAEAEAPKAPAKEPEAPAAPSDLGEEHQRIIGHLKVPENEHKLVRSAKELRTAMDAKLDSMDEDHPARLVLESLELPDEGDEWYQGNQQDLADMVQSAHDDEDIEDFLSNEGLDKDSKPEDRDEVSGWKEDRKEAIKARKAQWKSAEDDVAAILKELVPSETQREAMLGRGWDIGKPEEEDIDEDGDVEAAPPVAAPAAPAKPEAPAAPAAPAEPEAPAAPTEQKRRRGRPAGAKNKATLERERLEAEEAAKQSASSESDTATTTSEPVAQEEEAAPPAVEGEAPAGAPPEAPQQTSGTRRIAGGRKPVAESSMATLVSDLAKKSPTEVRDSLRSFRSEMEKKYGSENVAPENYTPEERERAAVHHDALARNVDALSEKDRDRARKSAESLRSMQGQVPVEAAPKKEDAGKPPHHVAWENAKLAMEQARKSGDIASIRRTTQVYNDIEGQFRANKEKLPSGEAPRSENDARADSALVNLADPSIPEGRKNVIRENLKKHGYETTVPWLVKERGTGLDVAEEGEEPPAPAEPKADEPRTPAAKPEKDEASVQEALQRKEQEAKEVKQRAAQVDRGINLIEEETKKIKAGESLALNKTEDKALLQRLIDTLEPAVQGYDPRRGEADRAKLSGWLGAAKDRLAQLNKPAETPAAPATEPEKTSKTPKKPKAEKKPAETTTAPAATETAGATEEAAPPSVKEKPAAKTAEAPKAPGLEDVSAMIGEIQKRGEEKKERVSQSNDKEHLYKIISTFGSMPEGTLDGIEDEAVRENLKKYVPQVLAAAIKRVGELEGAKGAETEVAEQPEEGSSGAEGASTSSSLYAHRPLSAERKKAYSAAEQELKDIASSRAKQAEAMKQSDAARDAGKYEDQARYLNEAYNHRVDAAAEVRAKHKRLKVLQDHWKDHIDDVRAAHAALSKQVQSRLSPEQRELVEKINEARNSAPKLKDFQGLVDKNKWHKHVLNLIDQADAMGIPRGAYLLTPASEEDRGFRAYKRDTAQERLLEDAHPRWGEEMRAFLGESLDPHSESFAREADKALNLKSDLQLAGVSSLNGTEPLKPAGSEVKKSIDWENDMEDFDDGEDLLVKAEDDTFTPPESVASAARRGLDLRDKQSESNKGGTSVGIARAKQLANRQPVSYSTIKRMASFFARHAVDKQGEGWGKDSKGFQAWLLWGGDPGHSWADSIVRKMENRKDKGIEKHIDSDEQQEEAPPHLRKAEKGPSIPKKYVSGLSDDKASERKEEIRRRANDPKPDYKPLPGDEAKTKPSKYTRTSLAEKVREEVDGPGDDEFIRAAAKVSGVSARIIRQVMRRGAEAWETGHRPGASQAAWSRARVYSFLTGGKTRKTADADLAREIKKSLDDLELMYFSEEDTEALPPHLW